MPLAVSEYGCAYFRINAFLARIEMAGGTVAVDGIAALEKK
jgi:hypothetical protein